MGRIFVSQFETVINLDEMLNFSSSIKDKFGGNLFQCFCFLTDLYLFLV